MTTSTALAACCPACGHSLAGRRGVNVDLDSGVVVIDDKFAAFTPKQAELVSILVSSMPRVISKEGLMMRLYPQDDGPEIKIIDVWVCKIRKELDGSNLRIVTHWGRGYSALYEGEEHGG